MKKFNPWISSAFLLSILSILVTLVLYTKLPSEIPIHFNASGEVDNWGPKSFALFTASLPILLGFFTLIIPKIDPKRSSFSKHAKAYNIFIFFIVLFMLGIHWATFLFSLGYNISVDKVVMVFVGILFIIMGNYMPQIRHNYTFGVKTPWALHDENNWRATQRFGGYMFIIMGITSFLHLFIPSETSAYLFLVVVLGGVIACYFYSYLYFKKHTPSK
ncbi:MAG: SdpI family protein [Cellulosilyticaceae bacterium]